MTDDPAATIIDLHQSIIGALQVSLDAALRIGELLTNEKARLPHGKFTQWIADNLPFSDRTARRYMRLHADRGRLKTDSVSDLASAYRLMECDSRASRLEEQEQRIEQAREQIRAAQAELLKEIGGLDAGAVTPPSGCRYVWNLEHASFTEYLVIEPHEQAGHYFTTYMQVGPGFGFAQGDKRGLSEGALGDGVVVHNAVHLVVLGTRAEVPCEPLNYNRWLYDSWADYTQRERESWDCECELDETGFCSKCGSGGD